MTSGGGDGKPQHLAIAVNQYKETLEPKGSALVCNHILKVMKSAEGSGIIQFSTTGNNILFKSKIKDSLPESCKKFLKWFEEHRTTDVQLGGGSQYSSEAISDKDIAIERLTKDKKIAEEKLRIVEEKLAKQEDILYDTGSAITALEHENTAANTLKDTLTKENIRLTRAADEARTAYNAEKAATESRIYNAKRAEGDMRQESNSKTGIIDRLEHRLANSSSTITKLEHDNHSLSNEKITLNEELRMARLSDRSKPNTTAPLGMINGMLKLTGDSIGVAACHLSVGIFRAAFGDSTGRNPKRKRDDD
jgi:hypothetical protein